MSLSHGRPPPRTPHARRAGSAAGTSRGFSWRAFLLYNVAIAVAGSTLRAVFVGSWRGWAVAFVVFLMITFTISGIMELCVPLVDRAVRRRPPRVQLLALNALFVVGGVAGFAFAFHLAHALFGVTSSGDRVVTPGGLAGAALISVLVGNLFHAWERLRERLRESEEAVARQALERERLEKLRVEAELAALQARINPHFLFNTLNSLAALIPGDPAAAEEMTQRLADCFRYALRASHGPVALHEELAFVADYLALEGLRFGARLDARVELDPSAAEVRVPGLVVQPLVENALKHGIGPLEAGGSVRVRAALREGLAVVTVEDDGQGLAGSEAEIFGGGTGLANVRDRVRTAHGPPAGLRLERRRGGGTRVVLWVPAAPGAAAAAAAAPPAAGGA